ncbi:MAG: NAD(P)/FAD-dependent oxidoreductase [Candidatus Nanopelagicales bacterium]
MLDQTRWDVAIVGAGTAGSAAAFHCARLGLSTVCIDRQPHGQAGAHWLNGVPGWMFSVAGLVQPVGDELIGNREPFHMLAGTGASRITITNHDLLDVDMGLLVKRLQLLANDAGAALRGGVTVGDLSEDGLETSAGVVRARWFVDASGMSGARLLRQPRVEANDICSAAQEVRTVTNRRAALRYFRSHDVPEGQTLAFTGTAGGFSTVNLTLRGDRVALLTGSIPAHGHPSGRRLISELVAANPWIGDRVTGGHRSIPLRRPFDRLANDRVALIGDAACQVFPAHGSGIGPGLIAAKILAEELADDGSPHTYAVHWMRNWGAILAVADQFRRFSEDLEVADLARLMDSGLIGPASAARALDELPPQPSISTLTSALRGALRDPLMAARLVPVLARSAAMLALYSRYPRHSAGLPAWIAAVRAAAAD